MGRIVGITGPRINRAGVTREKNRVGWLALVRGPNGLSLAVTLSHFGACGPNGAFDVKAFSEKCHVRWL